MHCSLMFQTRMVHWTVARIFCSRPLFIIATSNLTEHTSVAYSQMRSILFIFCILVLSSVSHISGQSCTTNEQCTDPVAAPLCRNGTCGTCNESAPAECLARSPNSPICSSGGCYPCISTGDYATECGQLYPATPICSNDTGACRACAADSECTIYGETMHCQNGSCV